MRPFLNWLAPSFLFERFRSTLSKNQHRTSELINNSAGLMQQAGGDKVRKDNKKLTLRFAIPLSGF